MGPREYREYMLTTLYLLQVVEILEGLVEQGSETMDLRNRDEVTLRMKAAVASKQYGQESILCPLIADVLFLFFHESRFHYVILISS